MPIKLGCRAFGYMNPMGFRSSELDEPVKIITIQMGKLGFRKEKGSHSKLVAKPDSRIVAPALPMRMASVVLRPA